MRNHDFQCVFYSNFTPIMNRFRDNDVFLQTGNDAILISRRAEFLMNVPKWVTTTFYLWCKVTSPQSCAVSEILIFSCKLELKSTDTYARGHCRQFLRRILKGRLWFPLCAP